MSELEERRVYEPLAPGGLRVILLASDCSTCGVRGFHHYCRECGAMYCCDCDCWCGRDEDDG